MKHWTETDFKHWLYGLKDQDQHLDECPACRGEMERLKRERAQIMADPAASEEVSPEFLAAQRRQIYQRLEQPAPQSTRFALGSFGRDVVADGRRHNVPAIAQNSARDLRRTALFRSLVDRTKRRAQSDSADSQSVRGMMLRRFIVLLLVFSACLFAQMPKGIYAWWSRPEIAKDLNLSPAQRQQIRATVQQYRAHLLNVRSEVSQAEQELADQFNHEPIDPAKTNDAIERVVDARSDLTRTLTQLSLKLRLVLTEQQWQELQRRRPGQGGRRAPAQRISGPEIIRTAVPHSFKCPFNSRL